jgi:hypothetical protein
MIFLMAGTVLFTTPTVVDGNYPGSEITQILDLAVQVILFGLQVFQTFHVASLSECLLAFG